MSDYDRERGKLIPLCKKGEAEQTILNILEKEHSDKWKEYQEKWPEFTPFEALNDISYENFNYPKYLLIHNILYENINYEKSHEVEFCNIKEDLINGDIEYDTCYWNGGTYLDEVLNHNIKIK